MCIRDSYYIDVSKTSSGAAIGNTLKTAAISSSSTLRWVFNYDSSTGFYKITYKDTSYVMTYDPASGKVKLASDSGYDTQRWMLAGGRSCSSYIMPKADLTKTLCTIGGSVNATTEVQAYSIASSYAGASGAWAIDYYIANGIYDFGYNINSKSGYITPGASSTILPGTKMYTENISGGGDYINSNARWRLEYDKNSCSYTISPSYNPVHKLYATYNSSTRSVTLENRQTGNNNQLWLSLIHISEPTRP